MTALSGSSRNHTLRATQSVAACVPLGVWMWDAPAGPARRLLRAIRAALGIGLRVDLVLDEPAAFDREQQY